MSAVYGPLVAGDPTMDGVGHVPPEPGYDLACDRLDALAETQQARTPERAALLHRAARTLRRWRNEWDGGW